MSRLFAVLMAFAFLSNAAAAEDRPRVIVVNAALQYFAERLLGDSAEVVFPVPEGVDPSFWRPSISDISAIQSADLIVLNGAGFAAWTTRVSLPRSKLLDSSRGLEDSFIVTDSITHSHGDGGEHSHEGLASYTWLDPAIATSQAQTIAEAVKERGLAEETVVDERMAALAEELASLETLARADLKAASDTVFIATHPRYQYLARAYGLTVFSVAWEAGATPSETDLTELQALADEIGAGVLIWEAEPSAAARQAVANLGLEDAVFPTFATNPSQRNLTEVYSAAVRELAGASARARID